MASTDARFSTAPAALHDSFGLDAGILDDVRAVGMSVSHRVPEMIEDFYVWLAALPEYEQFFQDEHRLSRVKAYQIDYWRDFLRAEVDDGYVHRRRIVGQTHTRISLGLMIYLQAMEFVSEWFCRHIETSGLLQSRPMARFAVRKLIEFDAAVVIDTYGRLTAERLEQQRVRLAQVATVMHAVAEGDLHHRIEVADAADVLGTSLNEMVESLGRVAREMGAIARGELSERFVPRGPRDELGVSLQAMTQALRKAAAENEQLIWMANAQSALGEAMSGNPSMRELSRSVLSHLCRALRAHVGTLYVLEGEELKLTATYAASAGAGARERWMLGEGLVGQAAEEKQRILVTEIPRDSLRIRFGSGEAIPSNVVVLPVVHEGSVRGVIELGVLNPFSDRDLELLDRVSPSIGLAISAAESRARIRQLLEESQAQGQELTAQQEELRQVNDMLADQTRALQSQKENLIATESILRHQAAELERASKYKSEFLANMSHELRTPLNSSLILSRLLMENRDGNLSAEQVSYAQTIYSAGNELLALINDILDLSKIEAGKVQLDIEPVSLAQALEDLRARFEPLAHEKALAFAVEIDPRCPALVHTDKQRLRQILLNLISNAIKFTERGSIRVAARALCSEQVALSVTDTGIGIPPEQHEAIFVPFQQGDGTISRKYGGTGLGLSISRELAALLGGSIEMQSAVGKGSVFTLVLPARTGQPEQTAPARAAILRTPAEAPEPQEPPSRVLGASATPRDLSWIIDDDRAYLTGRRGVVLVIEDDPHFAAILRDLARELGFQCVAAGGAEAGLRLAREHAPVAVILDIGLPDHTGLTVLELLKRDASTRHVPIHVISVHDYQQVALEMGAVGYILKPVKREQLASAFEALEQRLSRRARGRLSKSIIVKGARSPERLLEEVTLFLHQVEAELPADNQRMLQLARNREAVFEGRRILLVEDDVRNVFALTSLLETKGAAVDIARNGQEALDRLGRGPPIDLVLMDVMMPVMDGLEATRQIRKDARRRSLPIIALTAKAMPDDRRDCLAAGANDYIAKPVDSEKLLSLISVWMPK